MTAVILANGEFPRREYPLWLLKNADVVVCCDGAYRHLSRLGITPVAVVGDMDSLSRSVRTPSRSSADPAQDSAPSAVASLDSAPLFVKVEEQEYNDLNKAFCWLRENYPQASDIHIVGATGKSEAHALGNLSYLMFWEQEYALAARGVRVEIVSDYNTAFAIADSCELHVGEERKVSLFSTDSSLRIKSAGLAWPTDNVVFSLWFRGTLNRATSDVISLQFNHPAPVLIILD